MNGLFAHTLTDLIRGIRQNKKNEQAYIAKEIADIRLELRRNDPDLKAQAIAKLTYVRVSLWCFQTVQTKHVNIFQPAY